MRACSLIALISLIVFSGCNPGEEPSKTAPAGSGISSGGTAGPVSSIDTSRIPPVLTTPMKPQLVESPAEALPFWRESRDIKPVLVLLSNDPFLRILPEPLHAEIVNLANEGTAREFAMHGSALNADPVMLPVMAVRAALEAGFFSQFVWVYPSSFGREEMQLEVFREQMKSSGNLSEAEAATLTLQDGCFRGEISGVPFQASPALAESLPKLDMAVVLHLDLGFIKPVYKGEIKTPLYPLLFSTLDTLKGTGWKTKEVTISFSNLEGEIPLASRFVARDLATMFSQPDLLREPLPQIWQQRGNALYLENFFKKEEVRELYLGMEAVAPKDASVKYALYNISRQFKEGDAALAYLRLASDIDPVYALEYLDLAGTALKGQRPDKAIEMLEAAQARLTDNAFILLELVRLAINTHRQDIAGKLLPLLKGQNWSTFYHPGIVEEIEVLETLAKQDEHPG